LYGSYSDILNMGFDLKHCLKMMAEKQASDLHLKVGTPPIVRKNNSLAILIKNSPLLSHKDIQASIDPLLSAYHKSKLIEDKQLDFSYGISGLGRFRFNIFYQRGTLRVVVRNIPFEVPPFEVLNLPLSFKQLVDKYTDGLILVTGATGNGKSTTVVSMLNHINQTQSRHIITIEDPVEFLIPDKKSLITQRELGTDYVSYEMALKASLRQDPDIIFFGELRDMISTETALNASNTGHLVISTLHTSTVAETINRILGMFERGKEKQIRMEFASSLRAIICQKLILKQDKSGFIPAIEILYNNPRVRKILEDDTKSTSCINEILETSKEGWKMQSFNQHLIELESQGLISQKEALIASPSPDKLGLHFEGLSHDNKKSLEHNTDFVTSSGIDGDLPSMEQDFEKHKKAV